MVRHVVLYGCAVDASLLHIVWCLVANTGGRGEQQCKKQLPVSHLMYVHSGFGKHPF